MTPDQQRARFLQVVFSLADQGFGQRAEDRYEAAYGRCALVDDVLVTEGDAVAKAMRKAGGHRPKAVLG